MGVRVRPRDKKKFKWQRRASGNFALHCIKIFVNRRATSALDERSLKRQKDAPLKELDM